jgi:hypothetical protein
LVTRSPGIIFLGLGFFTLVNACARVANNNAVAGGGTGRRDHASGCGRIHSTSFTFRCRTIALAASRRVVPEVGVILSWCARSSPPYRRELRAARLFFQLVERHFVTLPARFSPETNPLRKGNASH